MGAAAGVVCALAVGLKYTLGYDDSLDVVGVHLVGGVIGTVLIGLFATTEHAAASENGLFYGGGLTSLGHQSGAAAIAIVWSGVATLVIGLAIKYTLGWRVADEAEVEGIDFNQHGETAYDLHTGLGGGALTSTSVLAASTAAPALKNEGANA
jgi:Amt family ammonium transporter